MIIKPEADWLPVFYYAEIGFSGIFAMRVKLKQKRLKCQFPDFCSEITFSCLFVPYLIINVPHNSSGAGRSIAIRLTGSAARAAAQCGI